jgi:predicted glutamine amidotransferase
VSATPLTLAEALGEDGLAALHALSYQHADGWGMAWWDGAHLRSQRSHQPAYSSPAWAAATREFRSDAALVHLRWATPGITVAPENTHPFLVGDWAFGHNGAVRPADGLLPLLSPGEAEHLQGDTDSERLHKVLLARVSAAGLEEGLRQTVSDVCDELTPSSLNALLLGRDSLTAVCCHGAPSEGDAPVLDGPPEDQPGYFDLRWRRVDDAVVVASQPLGASPLAAARQRHRPHRAPQLARGLDGADRHIPTRSPRSRAGPSSSERASGRVVTLRKRTDCMLCR